MAAAADSRHIQGMRTLALIAALVGLLIAAVWFAIYSWNAIEGPPIPAEGYVMMALGVGFSLVVGIGLMALMFYSSRHGYDEPAKPSPPDET